MNADWDMIVVGGGPAGSTLAGRPGLEAFKDARMGAGGFFTIGGLLALVRDGMAPDHHPPHMTWSRLFHLLQAKGVAPIVFTSSPGDPTTEEPGGMRDVRITIPADTIRDAVTLGIALDGT